VAICIRNQNLNAAFYRLVSSADTRRFHTGLTLHRPTLVAAALAVALVTAAVVAAAAAALAYSLADVACHVIKRTLDPRLTS